MGWEKAADQGDCRILGITREEEEDGSNVCEGAEMERAEEGAETAALDTGLMEYIWLHSCAYAYIQVHMVAFRCLWLHSGAYGCIQLHMVAFSCLWLHSAAYGCVHMLMVAFMYLWLHSGAYGCI
ncbi:hypothetical protein Taro_025078 [Colocasia esculenta]|uniref:Uncharacterized protein n=1 Tax=Colocasia esculenta TaxID=4460 RepID=A0A843VJF1_COLES|nr:hypothetical protein [Colocasia esculenta]